MKNIITLLLLIISNQKTEAQGCVAIRGTGAVCTRLDAGKDISEGWQ
ncbi:MAG: hypothetical protein WKF70_12625 [Chitinophagaceae bacterium]